MYIGVLLSRKVCTECMAMDIFPESCHASDHRSHLDLEFSVRSKEKKILEYANHCNVSFVTIHAKTKSPVDVQPLHCRQPQLPTAWAQGEAPGIAHKGKVLSVNFAAIFRA